MSIWNENEEVYCDKFHQQVGDHRWCGTCAEEISPTRMAPINLALPVSRPADIGMPQPLIDNTGSSSSNIPMGTDDPVPEQMQPKITIPDPPNTLSGSLGWRHYSCVVAQTLKNGPESPTIDERGDATVESARELNDIINNGYRIDVTHMENALVF